MHRRDFLEAAAIATGGMLAGRLAPGAEGLLAGRVPVAPRLADGRYLYVATPGIRNYVEYGGVGILVFDVDNGHRLVRRIPTFEVPGGDAPENVKGVAANARTRRVYVATHKRLASFDLVSGERIWIREYAGGCDRLAIAPDGRTLYVPSFEGPHWHVVNASTGGLVATVVTNSGAHNTIYGADGKYAYLAGLRSPRLFVADTRTHQIVKEVGPFSSMIRPFTINAAQTLCFVNVNDLLGFEVGDLKSGRMLHRVQVAGYEKGPVKRHGCPSHGVGLTPDESEVWVTDGPNSCLHIFDATTMPPRQVATITLRDQPGWVTFSLDGVYAYPSTGEVIDTATRCVVTTLEDDTGRQVQSEKMVELVVLNGSPVRTGDQFGIGRRPR